MAGPDTRGVEPTFETLPSACMGCFERVNDVLEALENPSDSPLALSSEIREKLTRVLQNSPELDALHSLMYRLGVCPLGMLTEHESSRGDRLHPLPTASVLGSVPVGSCMWLDGKYRPGLSKEDY